MEKQISNRAYRNAQQSIKRHYQKNHWRPKFNFDLGFHDFLNDYMVVRNTKRLFVRIYQAGRLVNVELEVKENTITDSLRDFLSKHESVRYIVVSAEILDWVDGYTWVLGQKEHEMEAISLGYSVDAYVVSDDQIADFLGTV